MAIPFPKWALTFGSTTKSFADWKLAEPDANFVSQASDTVTITQKAKKIETATKFTYGAEIIILQSIDGVTQRQWFRGRVTAVRKSMSPSTEGFTYTISGGWWYFEHVIYNQIWKSWVTGTTFENKYSSLVLLNLNTLGAKRTTGQQIIDAINYAIDESGIPIQIGTISPSFDVPIDEKQDITVAEVIRLMLRWHPDAVAWFDYSTTVPTFNVKSRYELAVTTLALNEKPNAGIDITRRDDLGVPSCAIRYRIQGDTDGQQYRIVQEHVYPPGATGREFGALSLTIDMQGQNISFIRSSIETDAIDATNVDWWTRWNRKLSDENIRNITLDDVLIVDEQGDVVLGSVYPNQLVKGSIAEWMGFDSSKVIVSAVATYELWSEPSGGYLVDKVKKETVFVECKATNGFTGDFSTVSESEEGEAIPVNLEHFMYDAINNSGAPQFEGTIVLREREATGLVGMGQCVNISGLETEWSTMQALVQSVRINGNGTTTVTVGVPDHLSAGDIVELLRVNRSRRRFTLATDRTEGSAAGGSEVDYPNHTPNNQSDHSSPNKSQATLKNESTGWTHTIDALAGHLVIQLGSTYTVASGTAIRIGGAVAGAPEIILDITDANGKTIKLREFTVSVKPASGPCVDQKVLLMASDYY